MLKISRGIALLNLRVGVYSRYRTLRQLLPPATTTRSVNERLCSSSSTSVDTFGELDPKFRDSKFNEDKNSQKQQQQKKQNRQVTRNAARKQSVISENTEKARPDKSILDKYRISKTNTESWQDDYLQAKEVYEQSQDAFYDERDAGSEFTKSRSLSLSADVFGTLDPKVHKRLQDQAKRTSEEDDEIPHHIRLSKTGRVHTQNWYDRRILKLCNKGEVVTALDLLEEQMIAKDRVKPTVFAYAVVITGLGKSGHLKLAIELFFKMKEYGLKPNDYVFSSLFNACANSPVKSDAIQRADYLRRHMSEKNIVPAFLTYKAMIKAYAIHGEVETSFALISELIKTGYRPDADCYAMLLIACISDKETGFKRAIEVWRLMRLKGITPRIFHYNLLVRAIRDCGVGSAESARQLLGKKRLKQLEAGGAGEREPTGENRPQLSSSVNTNSDQYWWQIGFEGTAKNQTDEKDLKTTTAEENSENRGVYIYDEHARYRNTPNILSPRPDFRGIVGFAEIATSGDRLALIGGVDALLSHMRKDNVQPDIKTMTQMMDIIPSTTEAETALEAVMDREGVRRDTDFVNLMMKRRVYRKDLVGAQAMFKSLTLHKLTPNFRTYGILALTCSQRKDGLQFIQDIKPIFK
ncbi:pentatricopeptide repeat-containing protein 1, mitochondrial-like isoform X2 [Tubulanus polymorphus]|uniref:pentatricopeptide repeat-containing protein 1, mitochondrial-like isoform X2 n=1 Tax=Tubulanus polymorphus TaxID=672921 RepID=UPI003DA55E5F